MLPSSTQVSQRSGQTLANGIRRINDDQLYLQMLVHGHLPILLQNAQDLRAFRHRAWLGVHLYVNSAADRVSIDRYRPSRMSGSGC